MRRAALRPYTGSTSSRRGRRIGREARGRRGVFMCGRGRRALLGNSTGTWFKSVFASAFVRVYRGVLAGRLRLFLAFIPRVVRPGRHAGSSWPTWRRGRVSSCCRVCVEVRVCGRWVAREAMRTRVALSGLTPNHGDIGTLAPGALPLAYECRPVGAEESLQPLMSCTHGPGVHQGWVAWTSLT